MKTMEKTVFRTTAVKSSVEIPRFDNITAAFQSSTICPEKKVTLASQPDRCPRCEHDVYALAIKMHYYIGAIYLDLADSNKNNKAAYTSLAAVQLAKKDEISRHSNERLDQLLYVFYYVNEGQVINPPISEIMAEEIQPDFDAILTFFMNQIDDIVEAAINENLDITEVENKIAACMVETCTQISMLYKVDEIQKAFDEVLRISQ